MFFHHSLKNVNKKRSAFSVIGCFVLHLPQCDYTSSLTHKSPPYLEYLTAVRGAVNVLAGLVHAKRHTVEQDHHDANPLEPRADITGVKERGRRGKRVQHATSISVSPGGVKHKAELESGNQILKRSSANA